MQLLNIFACSILFAFSSWAILCPTFKDGILLKKALILLALASFAGIIHYFDPQHEVDAQTVLLNLSFAFIAMSMVRRRIVRPAWGRK